MTNSERFSGVKKLQPSNHYGSMVEVTPVKLWSPMLILIGYLYLAYPITFFIFSAVLFDIPGKGLLSMALSPGFVIASVVGVLAGLGILKMKRWAWHAFMLSNLMTLYFSATVVLEYGVSHHKGLSYIILTTTILFFMGRANVEIRVPYLFPKFAWWETGGSKSNHLPAELRQGDSPPMRGKILDLSPKGCFIKLSEDIPENAIVQLKIFAGNSPQELEGRVVWRASSTVTHPKGLGIQFSAVDRFKKNRLRKISNDLRKTLL